MPISLFHTLRSLFDPSPARLHRALLFAVLLIGLALPTACLAALRPDADPPPSAPVSTAFDETQEAEREEEPAAETDSEPGEHDEATGDAAERDASERDTSERDEAENHVTERDAAEIAEAVEDAAGEAEASAPARVGTPTAHLLPPLLPRRGETPAVGQMPTSTPDSTPGILPQATGTSAIEEDELALLLPTTTPTPGATATPRSGIAMRPGATPRATPRATSRATTGATSTPEPPDMPVGETTAAAVNLRGGPGTNYPVEGQIRSQDAGFEVIGRTEAGDWLQICCPNGAEEPVWISANFVDVSFPAGESTTSLPVPEIPPTPVPPPPQAAGQSRANPDHASGAGLPGPGNFGTPGGTNPLTGQALAGGRSGQRPIIVCINNDFASRPQLGTSQADVMYEYLMEGYGITRMSGIYYGADAGQIGPARSARLINYYMGALYDAGLACTGASDPVRYVLKHEAPFPYLDFDLDDPNATRYSTSVGTDYRTRMRTSTAGLRRWLADWGVERGPAIRGFTFGELPGGGAAATSITIPYPSGTGSQVAYRFAEGRYLRSMGGGAHVDGLTGGQLAYDNVVVQYVAHQATDIVEDSLGSTSIRLNLFGSNRAIVFRDGQAFVGTWRSESRGDLPRFFDAQGNEIALKPGRTFFSIVPESYTITYQ